MSVAGATREQLKELIAIKIACDDNYEWEINPKTQGAKLAQYSYLIRADGIVTIIERTIRIEWGV